MAHVNSPSPYRVGKYGVNTSAIDEVGIAALRQGMKSSELIIIDEIGRMEMYSSLFKAAVNNALDSSVPVLGVIQMKAGPFLDSIRGRDDATVIQVTPDNREELPGRLLEMFGLKT